MESTPTVSIIVPCRNEKDQIESCLASILQQEEPGGSFEIIVADGMSDDGSRDILQNLAKKEPRLRIVDNPARIVPTGLNAAIKVSKGKIIMRMDAHTEYSPDYVRTCLEVLQETDADNVGGPARTKAAGYLQEAICAAYHSPFSVGGAHFHNVDYAGRVDTVTYGCWPREVFDQVGLFDEELVRNQDDEFNLRLTRAGGKIWQSPRIKSWYTPRESLRDLFRQYMQYGYWKVRVIHKHRLLASVRHLIPCCFVLSLITLSVASLLWTPAVWASVGVVAIYSVCNLAASLLTAATKGWSLFPLLPLVFATYHISYGCGFLRGIVDFIILRRRCAPAFTNLTRNSPVQKSIRH